MLFLTIEVFSRAFNEGDALFSALYYTYTFQTSSRLCDANAGLLERRRYAWLFPRNGILLNSHWTMLVYYRGGWVWGAATVFFAFTCLRRYRADSGCWFHSATLQCSTSNIKIPTLSNQVLELEGGIFGPPVTKPRVWNKNPGKFFHREMRLPSRRPEIIPFASETAFNASLECL